MTHTMRTRGFIAIAVVAAVAAAYVVGYSPEHRARVAAEEEADALRARLDTAERQVRAGELLGQALTLKEVAIRQNYGQALELSSSFFNAVRIEEARSSGGQLGGTLTEILAMRDAVTAALAKADPTVSDTLHGVELRLRQALGYALPPESAPSPR